MKIEYEWYSSNRGWVEAQMEKSLPELFEIISTQMMDVAITETGISNALNKNLFSGKYSCRLSDDLFIKRILNQLKALGLLYSNWNQSNSTLFWGLTTKGQLERNKRIIVRREPDSEK